ncbi:glutamate dehydrogenase [Streptomyces sp. SID12501]|uniref:Glutamate dehydrogenase n=1 Tax=Streptomyces sp. SID12501 TaxID=2706042 RepID=A0A6B3BZ15_9ACTN|nr:glutamate dehydrogenase [Streptomyces sp. SID12501]NEC89687.1 glutamate dehydrogenase [Streptomyces sp. SID12501]
MSEPVVSVAPPALPHTGPEPEIEVRLPAVYLPMPWRRHPQVDLLERRGLAFMERHGLCGGPGGRERVLDTRSALICAGECPDADPERLQMFVDWTYLMFVFDDVACDEEAPGDAFSFLDLAVRVIRTLESPAAGLLPPGHPFAGALTELAERLHHLASPTQRRSLVTAHQSWFLGVAWERAAREQRLVPSVDDYLYARLLSAAGAPSLAWFQISEPADIPDTQINSPAVHALTEMSSMVATIDDDLYSYGKDLWFAARVDAEPEPLLNLVHLYRTRDGNTLEDALLRTVALRDRILARFVEVRDTLLPEAEEPLRRYLSNLACLIRGNYEYGLRAGRYTNPDGRHPGAVRVTGTASDTPSAAGAPADVPWIGSWWARLPGPAAPATA